MNYPNILFQAKMKLYLYEQSNTFNMIQTVTIDLINDKAMKLLEDMELLQLIHLHRETHAPKQNVKWQLKYKGAMKKQHIDDIDNQLNELRNAWE